jgi:hypothetical protein
MAESFQAWQCIGCGKIDGPAQCIGVCQDRRVELVNAMDYRAAQARIEALEAVLRRIALTTPKDGECEPTWLELQRQARKALAAAPLATTAAPGQ